MKISVSMLVVLMVISLTSNFILAQAPPLINYQGKLNIDGQPPNGTVKLTFRIYSNLGATATSLWTEVHDAIPVSNGVFSVILGSKTPFSQASQPLFTGNGDRFFGISVNDGNELPRFQLTSVAYAIRATQADEIASGQAVKSINNLSDNVTLEGGSNVTIELDPANNAIKIDAMTGTGEVADGSITTVKLANNAVTSAKILDGEVGNSDLAANSVTSDKIANNAVTDAKIGSGQVVKSINNLRDNVTLAAGNNITIGPPSGNTITINGSGGTDNDWNISGNNMNAIPTGNVGIGTSSPQQKLHVVGRLRVEDRGRYIELSDGNEILFSRNSANRLRCLDPKGTLSFVTGGRHDSDRASNLNLWENFNSSFLGKVTINTDSLQLNAARNPTYELEVNGTVRANNVSPSDRRWKKNIVTFAEALNKVSQLRGVSYEWRQDEFQELNFTSGKQIGVIAQEVEKVVPELVSTDKQGFKSVQYSKLTAILIEAVKGLKAENKTLEKRIEVLEEKLGAN